MPEKLEEEASEETKANEPKKSPGWLTVLTMVLSVVSALGVAFLGFQTKSVETNVKREEIAFQQSKFDLEQKNRDEEALKNIIPKILSKEEQDVKVGMATLFVLFPTRSKDILTSVQSALTGPQQVSLKDQIQPAVQRAQELREITDKWIIVIGGDKSLDDAKDEMGRAKKAGYSPTLYLKDGWFRTTVGPFPTQADAERTNIAVRATLRSDAYVVNLNGWCPASAANDTYTECGRN